MDVRELLSGVKDGALTIDEAERRLKHLPFENIQGYARIDHHRQLRSGFGEVVLCEGKTSEQVAGIMQRFAASGSNALGTRCSPEQYEATKALLPGCEYHELSRILRHVSKPTPGKGRIAVCTGGTADIPVAEEAALTAEFFGAHCERYYDVGVAGIHRLFAVLPQILKANVVVAVAGMEGALPSVLGGLVEVPVIAVPVSVGYGANFAGLSALLTMLNSCAEGIGVMNIDNGFGGGYMAAQINRLLVEGRGNTA